MVQSWVVANYNLDFKTIETNISQLTVEYVGPTILMNEVQRSKETINQGKRYSCIQGPRRKFQPWSCIRLQLRWCFFCGTLQHRAKNRNKEGIGLCFFPQVAFPLGPLQRRVCSAFADQRPLPQCVLTVRVASFIELRTQHPDQAHYCAKKRVWRQVVSIFLVLFEQQQVDMMPVDHFFLVAPFKSVALWITNTLAWCYGRLAISLDWCAWDLRWIARHFLLTLFPDAAIHKKEPQCVPKSFDVPPMYQSPDAVGKTSCQWYHCFLELLDPSLAGDKKNLSFQPWVSLFEANGFFCVKHECVLGCCRLH